MTRWQKAVLASSFLSESATFISHGDAAWVVAGESIYDPTGKSSFKFRDVAEAWLPPWGGGPDRRDPHHHLREASGLPPRYRASTYDWASTYGSDDINILSIGMHTDPIVMHVCHNGKWQQRQVVGPGIHESAQRMYDEVGALVGVVSVPEKPRVAWYEASTEPGKLWTEHLVGNYGGQWHGLGVARIDGNRDPSIVTQVGLYSPTVDLRAPWKFTPFIEINEDGKASDGLSEFCIMHAFDFEQGRTTLFGASPHGYGIWRWDLEESTARRRVYRRTVLSNSISQTHALVLIPGLIAEGVDLWLITGKRFQAHGAGHDAGWDEPALLVRIGAQRDMSRAPRFEVIDDMSGVGLKVDARRLHDGRLQVATSNKLGAYTFTEGH